MLFNFKFYRWLTAVRSYSHETGIEQAACDTRDNETMVEQQEANGKSQLQQIMKHNFTE